jgi:pimeloyl-ACP methyl ester carboxylesterase
MPKAGELTGAASFDVTGRLAEIRLPALVIHGARDRIVPAPTLSGSLTASPESGS